MPGLYRDLGDGLILRRAKPADTKALDAFNVRIHNFVADSLVSCVRDAQIWRFGLDVAHRESVYTCA